MLDYRAAAIIHHSYGQGAGIYFGLNGEGKLFALDFNKNEIIKIQESGIDFPDSLKLQLNAKFEDDDYTIQLSVYDLVNNNSLSSLEIIGLDSKQLRVGQREVEIWFEIGQKFLIEAFLIFGVDNL